MPITTTISKRSIALCIATLLELHSAAYAAQTSLSTQPLVTRSNVPPNVLFALSVEFPTATVAAYQDASGYTPANEYLGYFDPYKCYSYDGTNDWFYPLRLNTDLTCDGNAWSGNFLNWATMTGLDAFRLAMTGGNRYVDNGELSTPRNLTVLERTVHSGQGGFTNKNLTSSTSNRILNYATPLLSTSEDGNIAIFNTGLQTRVRFTRPAINIVNNMTFAQLGGTRVKDVNVTFKNYLTTTESNLTYKIRIPVGITPALVTVTGAGSGWSYSTFTGEITMPGLGTSLTPGQTKTVTVSYTSPGYMPLTELSAYMYRSGVIWGETSIEKTLFVRVKVCDSTVGREANCQLYGTRSYKPVGVIQKNGQDMRFGVFSYYLSSETANTVMRARLKTTSPRLPNAGDIDDNPKKEWSEEDGTFFTNPDVGLTSHTTYTDSGVINYINKFGRSGGYKTYDNIGRLYYESLAYLRNRPADTAFYAGATSGNAENFPVVSGSAWGDPIQASCQANYIVLMGDTNTHCDKKLPGGRFSASVGQCPTDYGSLENGDAVDVWQWTRNLGLAEGLSNWENVTFSSTNNSSSYLSGMAYYARTDDIRPDDATKPQTIGKQSVKTFIINVEEGGSKGVGSQFWYATKYGGFDDVNGNQLPSTVTSWSTADASYPGGRRPKTLLPASNPRLMIDAVKGALTSISADSGAASAAATSSPNITQTNNYLYSSTYRTIFWDGEVTAQRIDYATGNILPGTIWQASQTVNTQADALASGSINARKLYTFDTNQSGTDKKKLFSNATLTTEERGWFQNKCSGGSADDFEQCTDGSLNSSRRTLADTSTNLINFIRGYNTGNLGSGATYLDIFRSNRVNRLGDIVSAAPVYVGPPAYNFTAPSGGETYAAYKTRVSSRAGALYIAANDGFLHGFRGTDGYELFAYTPRQVMPDLYKLGDKRFSTNHRYYVDGTPVSMDVYDTDAGRWRTLLVGGLNNGGSGYYALDITDPTNPQALWEVCRDSTRCPTGTISTMGKSYGNPVITRLPSGTANAGKWVVLLSSGYNNSTGEGYLYVLDAITGAVLDTYANGSGSADSPSGMSKISTYAPNFSNDGVSQLAYAGDLNGNIWRFDLSKISSDADAVKKIVQLKDESDNPQPVTTKMEVGTAPGHSSWPVLFVGTGRYLSSTDFTDTQQQSIYALKDPFNSGMASTYSSSRGSGWVEQQVVDKTVGVSTVRSINTPQSVNWTNKNGWVIDLPDTGERVALDLQLNLGTLLVASNVVTGSTTAACQVGGYSWLYQLNYATGSYVPTAQYGQAATKFSNALLVGNTVTRIPSGALKVVSTTAKGEKVVVGYNTGSGGGGARKISWREVFK